MNKALRTLFQTLLLPNEGDEPIGGVDFAALPQTPAGDSLRAFAAALAGPDGSASAASGDGESEFLATGAAMVDTELEERCDRDTTFRSAVDETATFLEGRAQRQWEPSVREAFWRVFFPEGVGLYDDRDRHITDLRRRRTVTITAPNPDPITAPVTEILFTSNVLITTPLDAEALESLDHAEGLTDRIRATMGEVQLYYYDHPIHIGVETDNNEAIYGMRGLNDAIAWEKKRGRVAASAQASVVLSLSVTHAGLHTVAREYLMEEFSRGGPFEHLQIYLFTELDCRQIVESVLTPWLPDGAAAEVLRVFGVDGEYGRHYTFLKAIAAFWNVFIDDSVRGTFKIDLDQVFPQEELSRESGASAMEHFTTPLWGATGRDAAGEPVELGMIAGALVNEKDISRGLFTPDVPFPAEIPAGETAVFYNKLPMAMSTQAEMMTRYEARPDGAREDVAQDAGHGDPAQAGVSHGIDGEERCLQRYHVTGGTNGILVSHLREHRPFTPTFVGRAEDQAFILSVLYGRRGAPGGTDPGPYLRYVHKPGLIMRHDKEAFAGESIKAATHGRFIGDLARTWIYTHYAGSLAWGIERTKEQIDPFTGCFASPIPATIIFLRLVLYCAALLSQGASAGDSSAEETVLEVLGLAERKLAPLLEQERHGYVANEYRRERDAWDHYYDALNRAETALAAGNDTTAERARGESQRIITAARI